MSSSMAPLDLELLVQALAKQAQFAPLSRQQAQPLPLEKKAVGSPVHSRQRTASCQSPVEYMTSSPNTTPSKFSPPPMFPDQGIMASHRKLERSFSEQTDNRPSKSSNINPSRYKTEMCRPFEESGHCKYGDKCQFAHGAHELRNLARHPKYKTDLCRTFHTIGFCPYGPRCHFIHSEDEHKLNYIIQQKQQQAVQQAVVQQAAQVQLQQQLLQQQHPTPIQRPKLYLPSTTEGYCRNILGSTADSPPDSITSESPQSLSPTSGLGDDVFSPTSLGSTTLTPPPFTLPQEFTSALTNLNLSIRNPKPIMTPLQVETDALASLVAGLSFPPTPATATPSSLPDSTGSSLNSSFHTSLNTPPTPPESLSGDEELQRSLRLPFFSQLEQQQHHQH